MFRWPKLILLGLGVVTFIFCMIAVSEVGFPYRAKTNVMRISCLVRYYILLYGDWEIKFRIVLAHSPLHLRVRRYSESQWLRLLLRLPRQTSIEPTQGLQAGPYRPGAREAGLRQVRHVRYSLLLLQLVQMEGLGRLVASQVWGYHTRPTELWVPGEDSHRVEPDSEVRVPNERPTSHECIHSAVGLSGGLWLVLCQKNAGRTGGVPAPLPDLLFLRNRWYPIEIPHRYMGK